MNFNNLKIAQKLALGLGAVLFFSAVMAVMSYARFDAPGKAFQFQEGLMAASQHGAQSQAADAHFLLLALALAGTVAGTVLGIVTTRRLEASAGRSVSTGGDREQF